MQRTLAPTPWLVADIGGTNARFALVDAQHEITQVQTVAVAAHGTLVDALRTYLQSIAVAQGSDYRAPRYAALAVATPVTSDAIAFTNSPWSFSRRAVAAEMGLDALIALNDFEALALSLPRLTPSQLRAHDALPSATGTLAVVGPGTGLGVGGVMHTPIGWKAIAGEGGHVTLAPFDDFESALLGYLRTKFAHVSAERLLSGVGLPSLYDAVAVVRGEQGAHAMQAKDVVETALARGDPIAVEAIDVFCAMLGGFCGNVALTLGARSGVFVGGGIVPRLGERFFASQFRARFEAKGRFSDYLARIPTAVVTDTLAALSGAALALEQLS